MAGSAIIGALRVVLGADTAALEKDLKRAQGTVGNFASGLMSHWKAISAAIAGGALGVAIKSAINDADALGKTAQKIGIPVEELSKLRFAAELADVPMQTLQSSMVRLSRNMSEVAGGAKGPTADAFKALGIAVTNADGTLKSSSQVLSEVAAKFATYKDSAAKTALAVALFGKAGAEMIPLLNEGADGIAKMKMEAEELGIVIDDKTAAAADNFNDNLTRLGKVKDAMILKITAQMLPAFENLSNIFVDNAKNAEGFKNVADGLTGILRVLVTTVVGAWTGLQAFSSVIAGLISAVILAAEGQWSAALDALKTSWNDATNDVKAGATLIEQTWKDTAGAATDLSNKAKQAASDVGKLNAPILRSGEAADQAAKAMQAFLNSGERAIAGLEAESQTVGMSAAAHAALKFELEGLAKAKQLNLDKDPQTIENIQQTAAKIGALTQKIEDQRNAWAFANSTMDSAASGFVDIAMGTKSAKDAFKDFATSVIRDVGQMIVKFILLESVVKPLLGGFFGGGGFAGFLGFGGLGFANEGSFTVGGGTSMTDNAFVPLNLAAGERVTVDRPGSGNGASSDRAVVAVLQAPNVTSREFIRPIAEGLSALIRDGYVIKGLKLA